MKATAINLVTIALGGALGSALRFSVAMGVQRLSGWLFPVGTMAVNVLGSLAIGFLSIRLEATTVPPHIRLAILVGLLGGFTTYSSFSLDTVRMVDDREMALAAVNVVVTVLLCLVGCWLGQRLGRGL